MLGLKTLVLNSNYLPISLFPVHSIPVEDAVTRVFNKTCHVVSEYERKILTPSLDMRWPSVIARNEMAQVKEKVKLRRESLYYRDHGICVYCEEQITINDLTFDHVYPRALGGKHSWDNVVSACSNCNIRKGHSLPVGEWKPKKEAYEPSYYQLLSQRKKFPIRIPDASWVPFLGEWKSEIIVG